MSQFVQDYRDLWSSVVSDRLDKSLHQQMATPDRLRAGALLGRPLEQGATGSSAQVLADYTRVAAGSPPKRWATKPE